MILFIGDNFHRGVESWDIQEEIYYFHLRMFPYIVEDEYEYV